MKNIIVSIIASVFFLSSCSDFLDRNSLVGLSEGDFWKSQEDAIMGINSLYHANREFTNVVAEHGMLDDYTDIGYHSLNFGMTYGDIPTNAKLFSQSWGILYKGIYRANTAIKLIPSINMNEEIKKRLLGEAKFFRGYFYFKLWDHFGGVPIYDFPMNVDEAYKARNTEQEVYKFIEQDMTEAFTLLPENYGIADKGRATKWAALAMRGKAHLWAKQYDKAATDFKEVMKKSDRKLLDDYYSLFRVAGNNNSEVIFDVQYVALSGHGLATDKYYGNDGMIPTKGSQSSRPTPQMVNAFEMEDGTPFDFKNFKNAKGATFDPNNPEDWNDEVSVRKIFANRDPRLQQAIIVPWSTFVGKNNRPLLYKFPVDEKDMNAFVPIWKNGSYSWRKFVETGSIYTLAQNLPINFPLIRLADVMLMYAEAQNEALNAPEQSVYEAMNAVRKRAGITTNLPTRMTKEQMRDKIRHERMIELCCEGQRYSDIRRWKIASDVVDKVWMTEFTGVKGRHQKGFPDHFYLWPIPQAEMDLNPNLTQNPGWE